MVGDAVEPENLVKTEAQEGLDECGLAATIGAKVDKPVEGGAATDGTKEKFLTKWAFTWRQRRESLGEKGVGVGLTGFPAAEEAQGDFSWSWRGHRATIRRRTTASEHFGAEPDHLMKEEFEKLAAAGKIKHGDVNTLVELATEGFCKHRSWGVGQIKTVDTVLGKLTVDFKDRPGHSIDLAFAVKILEPITKGHIEARKISDMAGLRELARDYVAMVKLVLESNGGGATAAQIQEVLVPDVIEEDYKAWWTNARKAMKKDGHFTLPTKKTAPIEYEAQEVPLQDRLLTDFTAAKGLKARVAVVLEIVKGADDMDDSAVMGADAIALLNNEIKTHARPQPGLALEALFARDDLREATNAATIEGEPTDALIWEQKPHLDELLTGMAVAKQRRALQVFQAHNPDWVPVMLNVINLVPVRLCNECVQVLNEAGQGELLKETVARLINQHSASSDLLLWLAKNQPEELSDMLGPEVFRAMISAIERESEKKANKLRDYIVDDQDLVDQLTSSADLDVVKDITRAVQLSPSFEGMDKRSVLGKLVKSHPDIQSFITGDEKKEDKSLVVSWESLERRQKELEELVQRKIPANSKEIEVARSYGDLRENHEFKAAKEMQKVLMSRRNELEVDLERARGTDFTGVSTGEVNIGTRVNITNLDTGVSEDYAILGAWDSDPDNQIVSYQAPMGQALLGNAVGSEVQFDMGGEQRRYRIEGIAAWHPSPPAAQPETVMAAPEASQPGDETPEA